MLSSNFEEYAEAAAKLGSSLKQHDEATDMVLLELQEAPIPPEFDRQLRHWKRCVVPRINGPVHVPPDGNRFLQAFVYSKLNAWRLTEYAGILMLDLDIIAWRDPYDVFTVHLPLMKKEAMVVAAVRDRPLPNSRCRSSALIGGNIFPFTANFNAGVLLLLPNAKTFDMLRTSINTVEHNSLVDAEQALINTVFEGHIYELPIVYNAFTILKVCESHTWAKYTTRKEEIKLLHFTASKPWHYHWHKYWRNPHKFFSCWFWSVEDICTLWQLIES